MKQRMIGWLLPASVIIGMSSVACAEAAKPKIFNIRSYGAVGDGEAMETESVQKTIDVCSESGGGVVWIPAGRFVIGTVQVKSNVTLSFDHGAELLGSQNQADYPCPSQKLRPPCPATVYVIWRISNLTSA